MALPAERRSDDRQSCEAKIQWTYFNAPDAYDARLVNVSHGGGRFESAQAAIPGATLHIRVQRLNLAGSQNGTEIVQAVRTTALAEVKWCREAGSISQRFFEVGFRYHIAV